MQGLARRALPACFAVLGIVFCSHTLRGQATTSLRGTITDSTNAVIPEAAVTLTSKETGITRNAITNAGGEYQFSQVPPGEYTVTAERPGFAVAVENGVKLQVNSPATLDIRLEIGKTSETVAISAETPPINTTNASVGNNFTEKQIRQLPLLTRNVVELLSLQPGVTSTGEVLGARRDQNNITLDGVDVNDNQNAGIGGSISDGQGSNGNGATPTSGFNSVLPIPLDSVQEFRVTVAGQDANEGRSSGGQVALVTKSGSNAFHGSAYEFNRNTATAANTWFNNRSGVPREQLVRNQFGASLGGRVIKDRLFFFFNYERRLDSSAAAQERSVPSEALKQGILTVTTTDGGTYNLGPAALQKIDPLGIGINSQVLGIMKQYPTGNDAPYGADSGDNFTGFRFNAPDKLDNRAYVGKMDYVIDHAAHNTLSVRGTLGNSSQDNLAALAQFPGQSSASKLLDNSKGLSALVTSVITPNLVNAFNFGFTRQGIQQSGTEGAAFTFADVSSPVNYNARASGRILPVYNLVDDITWTKGKHTITTGLNFRLIRNNRYTYGQSFPSYGFSSTVAVGLGEDIQTDVLNYLQQTTGNSSLALASPDAVANAMGILLGAVNYTNITYQFLRNGSVLPQGQAQTRVFVLNEYEGYVADSWRANRSLTVTAGLRYSNNRPPYEASGLQVAPTVGLDQFFAQRNGEQAQGIPGNAQSLAVLQYALNGPVNNKPTWYGPDNKDFAPRFSFAYSPKENAGWLHKIFGDNGVFRGGYALVYDRFGSELITQFDQFGSLGLATTLGNSTSYNFTTAPRYDGSPAVQPPSPQGGFPYTPPDIAAIVGEFQGIYPNLKSPYAHLLNASFARQLPFGLTMEAGYVGRLSHRLLLQGDVYTPLEHFKDPASGETWIQSMTALRQIYDQGVTPNQVQSNPSLIPNNPFIQNMFPSLANYYIPGSASANYFYGVYGVYGGSYLDILHVLDRVPDAFGTGAGTCASRTGCYTFFARQGSSMPTWMNAGNAAFHAATISIRRAFKAGFQFDFNYTLSHSIDNASAAEGGAGQSGAVIQNIFDQGEFRGSSDFDIRHNITANFVYELPFGRGKMLLRNSSPWLNQVVGGWQLSSILRYASGLPSIVQGNYTWNTNYWQNSLAIPASAFHEKPGIDSSGNPGLFASTSASNSFADQYPGQTGTRALLRLDSTKNVDLALAKSFQLPFEGQRIQFRAEAFNAFNLVNFIQPSLALYSPSTFGEFTATTPPRVMQFALRYEF
jgi:hypothetical protein